MQQFLTEIDLPSEAVMAVGDGGNDYELVLNCGLGVAMANAVPMVCVTLTDRPAVSTFMSCECCHADII